MNNEVLDWAVGVVAWALDTTMFDVRKDRNLQSFRIAVAANAKGYGVRKGIHMEFNPGLQVIRFTCENTESAHSLATRVTGSCRDNIVSVLVPYKMLGRKWSEENPPPPSDPYSHAS